MPTNNYEWEAYLEEEIGMNNIGDPDTDINEDTDSDWDIAMLLLYLDIDRDSHFDQ